MSPNSNNKVQLKKFRTKAIDAHAERCKRLKLKFHSLSYAIKDMQCHGRTYAITNEPVFTATECEQILDFAKKFNRTDDWKVINFDGAGGNCEESTNRYMTRSFIQLHKVADQATSALNQSQRTHKIVEKGYKRKNTPDTLIELGKVWMETMHEGTTATEVRILYSDPPCQQQSIHADDAGLNSASKNTKWKDLTFSMIVAIEDNSKPTTILMATREKRYRDQRKNEGKILSEKLETIPQGSILIMRGDCPHAGTEYTQPHFRVHINTSTSANRHDPDAIGVVTK